MDSFDNDVLSISDYEKSILPNITLSPDQERAAQAVCDWFNSQRTSDNLRFILAGLAGTGKSTIIPFVLSRLNLSPTAVHFCAYTGKAALVLQSKGLDATTIHRLVYDPIVSSDGSVEFKLKSSYDPLLRKLKLIIVDEASMVGKDLKEDLESFNIPVLYVGDHGQLPPVGDDMARLMETPDVRLDQIHRQAEGNPIIRVAMLARKNGNLPHGTYGENVVKIKKVQLKNETLLTADQVLCGKNLTRRALNTQIRQLHGLVGEFPDPGDKLICLRNNWDLGLVNGMIGTLDKLGNVKTKNSRDYDHPHFENCTFTDETGFVFNKLNLDLGLFKTGKAEKWDRQIEQFDYGYAITVHKSQGSQYKNLLVFEEWLGDKSMHRLWLYTAVTRAIDNLIIVQG